MLTKKQLLTTAILVTILVLLVSQWITILNKNYVVKWHHITALVFFIPLPFLLFKNYKWAVIGTGIYLILGFLRLLTLTSGITTSTIRLLQVNLPGFNLLSLGLFVLFFLLHMDIIINLYLDHKERKRT